jgi:hypothetical protein
MAENDNENQAEKHTEEQNLAMASNLMDDLEQRLKTHDWFYMMSDDSRAYNNGSAEQSEIRKLIKGLEAIGYGEDAKKLYNTYAPYTPGGSDLRMKEAEQETHKMDEEEKHENNYISEVDMLDLYEVKEEEPVKKPTRTEIVDQIKHFLQEKY